jgi:AraC-like DNA-binding protein
MNRALDESDTAVAMELLSKDVATEKRVLRVVEMVKSGMTYAVRDLAAEFHLSPSYLQRLFKHQTGVRMGEWLTEQRLRRAAYLLSTSYLSIKEITHAVGYEHTSSFVRAFERRFQQAPARYRKEAESETHGEPNKRTRAA